MIAHRVPSTLPTSLRDPGAAADPQTVRTLLAVSQALAATTDHERILGDVIAAVCAGIDAQTGAFMLYDRERDELVLQKPAFGVYAEDQVRAYRVPLSGGGNAARVFLSREPYLANDARADPRLLQRFVRMFGTHNTVTVPLLLGNEPIGVFHVINKRQGDFNPTDLRALTLLAPLLAASLQAAQTLKAVEAERRVLARTRHLHQALTRIAVESSGLDTLCEAVERLLGRPILVLDAIQRPLAASGWSSLTATMRSALATLGTGTSVSRARLRTGRRRNVPVIAAPIRLGDQVGGHLVVSESGHPLDGVDVQALEQAATVFALQLLQERNAFESERHRSGDLLRELMSGPVDPARAQALLDRIGFKARGPWQVVRIEPRLQNLGEHGSESPGIAPLVQRALADALTAVGIESALVAWQSSFVTVLDPEGTEKLRDRRLLARFEAGASARATKRDGASVAIGVGGGESQPGNLARSLRGAEQALTAARRLPRGGPVFFEDLGVYRLLLGVNETRDHDEFVGQVLGPLFALAPARREPLMQTLVALTQTNFRVAAVARRLGIHLNTAKNRVQRLRELLGRDPAAGEARLETELALKILELKRGAAV